MLDSMLVDAFQNNYIYLLVFLNKKGYHTKSNYILYNCWEHQTKVNQKCSNQKHDKHSIPSIFPPERNVEGKPREHYQSDSSMGRLWQCLVINFPFLIFPEKKFHIRL